MNITPEQVEACRTHIEREHSHGEPGRVGGDETLAIIAGYQQLLAEMERLKTRLDAAEWSMGRAIAEAEHEEAVDHLRRYFAAAGRAEAKQSGGAR